MKVDNTHVDNSTLEKNHNHTLEKEDSALKSDSYDIDTPCMSRVQVGGPEEWTLELVMGVAEAG